MECPVLLPKLRVALSHLYSSGHSSAAVNVSNHDHHCRQHLQQQEAHEFLLVYKSSNMRRRVQSKLQSEKDKRSFCNHYNNSDSANSFKSDNVHHDDQQEEQQRQDLSLGEQPVLLVGSIYLSCLALLLQPRLHRSRDTNDSTSKKTHNIEVNNIYSNFNNSHERIFAAQTLNHRCRSIKLVECYDIEAEDGVECGVARLVLAWEDLKLLKQHQKNQHLHQAHDDVERAWKEKSRVILQAWLERYMPMLIHRSGGQANFHDTHTTYGSLFNGNELLVMVVERQLPHILGVNNANLDEEELSEEKIKGHLIVSTLAVAMYSSAVYEYDEAYFIEQHFLSNMSHRKHKNTTPWANVVLSELGSALAISVLRMRYRPTSNKHDTPTHEPSCPPLIDMLVQTINIVDNTAKLYFSQRFQHMTHQLQQHEQKLKEFQSFMEQAHLHATKRSVAACLSSLPETVLLPLGHGIEDCHRIPSVDRACLRAASLELRVCAPKNNAHVDFVSNTGIERMWKSLLESELGQRVEDWANFGDSVHDATKLLGDASASRLLECCDAWARFVSVPLYVLKWSVGRLAMHYIFGVDAGDHPDGTVLHSQHYSRATNAAFQYLNTIFEAASPSLTYDDILTATLGVSACKGVSRKGGGGGNTKNSNTKKKQGNKSKKRQEKRLELAILEQDQESGEADVGCGTADNAVDELLARKNAACVAAAILFGVPVIESMASVGDEFGLRSAAFCSSNSTHLKCSTVSIAASSVLPHILWLQRENTGGNEADDKWRSDLFCIILSTVERLCQCHERDIRALAFEPLMILHDSLMKNSYTTIAPLRVEQFAIEAICKCTLTLASSCGYPPDYFDNLSENNDEELEIERNDVRDVVRSVSTSDSEHFGGNKREPPSMLILERIVTECSNSIMDATRLGDLPPETAVHTLSALAKPLNKLGKIKEERQSLIIVTAILAYGSAFDRLNSSFDSVSLSRMLPISRLSLMGWSSLSPLFSSLVDFRTRCVPTGEIDAHLMHVFDHTLKIAIQHAILSSEKIPELTTESTLKRTRYDIKGAMRGPGGEDHVGCIALMRMCYESDALAIFMLKVCGSSILQDLFNLHQKLKLSEQQRAPSCIHGIGVAPMSRRLILKTLSRLSMIEMNMVIDEQNGGRIILQHILNCLLSDIGAQKNLPTNYDKLFRLCEAAYDLASLNSNILVNLFSNPTDDLNCIVECVILGYTDLSFGGYSHIVCEQWGRLRGGALCMLRNCFSETVTEYSMEAIKGIIRAECEAGMNQCSQGSQSGSNIFNDNVVGEDMLHSGAFIMAIGECLKRIASDTKNSFEENVSYCCKCITVLQQSASLVIPLLLHQSSEATSHVDPRPTTLESWFLTMSGVVLICQRKEMTAQLRIEMNTEMLLGDSINVAIILIFMKDIGNRGSPAPTIQRGVSLDGPQTLAMMDFVSDAILLGPEILASVARSFTSHFVLKPLIETRDISLDFLGSSIISAGILRAVSGALPPWVVELTPALMKSLYTSMGKDADKFIQILSTSTRLQAEDGKALAGRYFEQVSSIHIDSFLLGTKQICLTGEWNKLKSILKSACGGKKKDSGFNLKPHFTCWDCDRL